MVTGEERERRALEFYDCVEAYLALHPELLEALPADATQAEVLESLSEAHSACGAVVSPAT